MESKTRIPRITFTLLFCATLISASLFFIFNLTGCRMIHKDDTHFPMKAVSISQLREWQDRTQPILMIDTRDDHFFNGWSAGSDIPQGHIAGATSFQPRWLDLSESSENQQQLLVDKGITHDKTLVVYDHDDGSASQLYQYLKQLGYAKVFRLTGGIKAWGDAGYETVILPRYNRLVYPQWLEQQKQNAIILEVGYDEERQYRSGHIPGAVYLDTREIEWNQGTPSWNFIPDNRLAKVLAQYGIDGNTTVVVYADKLPMGAYRAAVGLLYAGVTDVRVLNGGKQAWIDQGYALESQINRPKPVTNTNLRASDNHNLVINIPEVKSLMDNPDGILASVMTHDEFDGKKTGYTYYSKAGHIPGAVLLENGDSAYDMFNYQDIDGTMRAWTEIEALWREQGVTADKEVSFYCGTGWRASEAFFAAYLMGWEKISVFDDGWVGWSMDPANPTIP